MSTAGLAVASRWAKATVGRSHVTGGLVTLQDLTTPREPQGTVWVMRAVLQRVRKAHVEVGDEVVGQVGPGWCALVGATHTDTHVEAAKLADKIANMRSFDDESGVMNCSVLDVGGEVLVVSQFTLYGDTSKGRRPGWSAAAPASVAEPLVQVVVDRLTELGLAVSTGRFQAAMVVSIVNDGPVTLLVEVENRAT